MAPQVAVEVASSDCVRPWALIMLVPSSENDSVGRWGRTSWGIISPQQGGEEGAHEGEGHGAPGALEQVRCGSSLLDESLFQRGDPQSPSCLSGSGSCLSHAD